MKIFQVLIVLCLGVNTLVAQDITGKWKTIDDETGQEKSIVQIYESDGKIYGKIVEILTEKKEAVCSKCEGDKNGKPILGMQIIEGLEKEDDVFEGGTILNPSNGKVYKCRLKIEDNPNTLQVRGYVAFFYKTQYWQRVK
ncbi:DUF2147 domain-containing protein [Winogradskyella sp. DF17]|uniref:DUF2147 domain-containing protein n=1 Tax=Winogradskyella pelagia TaxID=2819984 RepID=A0ABS3SZT6_9FLAO|nr:DUF2147 domain-containing protein [Winogradskyella sp. DF17]MBO3116001.1 DUF2147 domain-containing protein [Winogradskyella sp. DF17]